MKTEEPLRGTPAIRRVKTYAADTGYTWSYTFEGYRLEEADSVVRGYVFTVWSGTRTPVEVAIMVTDPVTTAIRELAGRDADARELYALAKMQFFAMLDEVAQPEAGAQYILDEATAIEIWNRLEL